MFLKIIKNTYNEIKVYSLLGILVTIGLMFYAHGFSINMYALIGNILLGYIFAFCIFIINQIITLILYKLFPRYKKFIILRLVIFFLISISISFVLIEIFALVVNFTNFKAHNFYTINNVFKCSFAIGFVAVAIYSVIITYKEKLRLERVNKKLLLTEERNKIAREIHDEVGHILIASIMQIELSKKLIKKGEFKLALKKLDSGQNKIRNGLDDIRKIVRLLKEDRDEFNLKVALKFLIKDFKEATNVDIKYDIDEMNRLNILQEEIIYKALKEGLTNGVKHSRADRFRFKLKNKGNKVEFLLKNNGLGTDEIKKGFGLANMEDRVKGQGGLLEIDSKKGKGFSLKIKIPIRGDNNERD
ncbi:sensor histidine kinase [Halonatronum saccharophilum]|uniref:sensor histidine kinase n=1 Tax=Halonatronum saccharophilum TaxID=150060 RepID=UPI0006866F49|nr:sensor histidine kinase [Halonatronum saccharophilum]